MEPSIADLDDDELIARYAEVRAELVTLGELVTQHTDEGRHLDADRQVCLHHMNQRNLR